jgi:hypothetical protein
MPALSFQGSVVALTLYDVCDEISLPALAPLIGGRKLTPAFKPTAPPFPRFEQPPVIESLGAVALPTGERFDCTMQYYDYGVVSVLLQRSFSGTWAELQQLSARWMSSSLFEELASGLVRQRLQSLNSALRNPYAQWVSEDYYVFHLTQSNDVTAGALIADCGPEISQVVSGEAEPLSPAETKEVLEARMSYYANDLTVVGWNAAFVYDTESGAAATIHLLEYANSQLIQFRHYDDLLTRELNEVYAFLEARRGRTARWRMRPAANRLQTVVVDVTQLTEHTNNALKFVGDMFSARLYKLCASRIGVVEYQELVREKLHTAEDLYDFMIEQFHQSRGFLLEAVVVVILLIELAFLFRGR